MEISVTSEKVSKDDPEENVCSFFVSTGDGRWGGIKLFGLLLSRQALQEHNRD